MKNYMNKEEREVYIKVLFLMSELEEIVKLDLSKEELKNLRSALTYLRKGVIGILDRLQAENGKFAMQINKQLDDSELMILPKSRAAIEKQEWEKVRSEEECIVNLNALDYLAEKALYGCCDCREIDKQACLLRNTFECLDIPMIDEAANCPYEP